MENNDIGLHICSLDLHFPCRLNTDFNAILGNEPEKSDARLRRLNPMKTLNLTRFLMAALLATVAGTAAADDAADAFEERRLNLEVSKDYALGLNKYRLDHETEMLGWRVSKSWYFGRQRGEDSGLTLVWQQRNNQVSFSKDGLRLTRRF